MVGPRQDQLLACRSGKGCAPHSSGAIIADLRHRLAACRCVAPWGVILRGNIHMGRGRSVSRRAFLRSACASIAGAALAACAPLAATTPPGTPTGMARKTLKLDI